MKKKLVINEKEKQHNDLVNLVREELEQRGHKDTRTFVNYYKGEIDAYSVISLKGHEYFLLFEIKLNDTHCSRKKAIDQLNRADRFYVDPKYRVFKFFVTRNVYDKPKYEWIK